MVRLRRIVCRVIGHRWDQMVPAYAWKGIAERVCLPGHIEEWKAWKPPLATCLRCGKTTTW